MVRGPFWTVPTGLVRLPFGKPRPVEPTRPQTSLKTAWRNTRKGAKVEGRFHDDRHTFVTDLAESVAGDQVIQDLAGHVSRDMVKHYSHIRTEAKRRAVDALSKGSCNQPQAEELKVPFVRSSTSFSIRRDPYAPEIATKRL